MAKLGDVPVDVEQLERLVKGAVAECLGHAGGSSPCLLGAVGLSGNTRRTRASRKEGTWVCPWACGLPGSTNNWIKRNVRQAR